MKKVLSLLLLMSIAGIAFSALINEFVSSYASQVIEGHRVIVEEKGETTRLRYENVLRNGYNEIVKVVAPDFFEWAYLGGKTYIVFGNEMKTSPATIIDSEKLFIKTLSSTPARVSTSTYNGKESYKIVVNSQDATYTAMLLAPSMILVYLRIKRRSSQIIMTYDKVRVVPLKYFEAVVAKFKIVNKPPNPMEVEVWKLVYHLDNVNIASLSINGISIAIVSGRAEKVGNVVAYVFKGGSNVSTTNLVAQFKSKGYSSFAFEQNGIGMVFAGNMEIGKLKKWVNEVFKAK